MICSPLPPLTPQNQVSYGQRCVALMHAGMSDAASPGAQLVVLVVAHNQAGFES